MAKKNSFTIFTTLFVEDYFDGAGDYESDKKAAFELAADACGDAVRHAREELEEAGVHDGDAAALKLEARFVEFDSGNLSHAGGLLRGGCQRSAGRRREGARGLQAARQRRRAGAAGHVRVKRRSA